MSNVRDIPVETITGDDTTLGELGDKVLLVVNVASKCGLTPQYEGLQQLHERFAERGFAVVGFPANNFGGQEPGTNEEIAEFCQTSYSVQFPLFGKISVVGDDQHPLYADLTRAAPRAEGDPDTFRERLRGHGITPSEDPDVLWNFEKFLVARDGSVVGRWTPQITPDDPSLVGAIEAQLVK